jgi:hypothetical protein
MLESVEQGHVTEDESRARKGRQQRLRVRRRARRASTERQQQSLQRQREMARLDGLILRARQAQEPLDRLCWTTGMMTKIVLLVVGFHQHDRGPWRRRRGHHGGY